MSPTARGPLETRDLRAYCDQACWAKPMVASRMTAATALRYKDRQGRESMDINDKAPQFSTKDENGKGVALKDFAGKTVVLFFFPKADTPG